MSVQYFVEVVKTESDEVVRRLGPHSERKADQIERGININLNDEDYHTRVVPEPAEESYDDG